MPDEIITKKSLGQHWLNDQASLLGMCEAASVSNNDTVLEIGPGPGSLTSLLVEKAGKVVAVELDEQLASSLIDRVKAGNLTVIQADIMTFDFAIMPKEYKVVANIPYYLTSNLIRILSETANRPGTVTLLVQQEVAGRAAAQPGEMSLLSVTAQFFWEVSLGRVVPAKLFSPPPKVDSQILILKNRPQSLFKDIKTNEFFRLPKAGFAQRRKTLLNSLSAGLQLSRGEVESACEKASISPTRRAQTLSLEEWYKLYCIIYT
jgi:16S rRNA (adenine1518-N6/adenine1519-N6)-dimethyltransferase